MKIEHRIVGDVAVIGVQGKLLEHRDDFHSTVKRLLDDGHRHLVVDLTDLDFISSTDLGVLIGGCKIALERGGSIGIVENQTLKELELVRIPSWPIYSRFDSENDALAYFEKHGTFK